MTTATMNQRPAVKTRVKEVFDTRELAHVWVHEGAPRGRCAASMSFDRDEFRSYSTVIARRMRYKGKIAYLVDTASFSITTSTHQTLLRRALPDDVQVFYISSGRTGQRLDFMPKDLIAYHVKAFEALPAELPRIAALRARGTLGRAGHLEEAIAIAEYFGLGTTKLKAKLAKISDVLEAARTVVDEYETKRTAKRDAARAAEQARQEVMRRERIAQAIVWCEELLGLDPRGPVTLESELRTKYYFGHHDEMLESRPDLVERLTAWRAAYEETEEARRTEAERQRIADKIAECEAQLATDPASPEAERGNYGYNDEHLASRPDLQSRLIVWEEQFDASAETREALKEQAWIEGKKVAPNHSWQTRLRQEGEEMVTSRGARVPIADAERTYRFAKRLQTRGWHRNGETHQIGHYHLDAVNEYGVVAGCHRVSWEEIDRFATQQGWVVAQ